VDSSIWEEEDHVFRVFMAMMSLKDADHVVRYDGWKLAKRIHMGDELVKVEDALRVLSNPDKRRPGQEFDGKRIEKVEGGWLILNGQKFVDQLAEERKLRRRIYMRNYQREVRRKMAATSPPQATERAAEREYDDADLDQPEHPPTTPWNRPSK
jgi:hypothetical protein